MCGSTSSARFPDSLWCHSCVLSTLDEQEHEAHDVKIKKQTFKL
jgi:hypothetical protein